MKTDDWQNTLNQYTEKDYFTELIEQKVREDAGELAYEDVRELLREQREAIRTGEDPLEIRKSYEERWNIKQVTAKEIEYQLHELRDKLLHCSNLRTEEGRTQAIGYLMQYLKVGGPKTVAQTSEETTIHRSTINRWAKDLENMKVLKRVKGVLTLVLENPLILDGTQDAGIHHIMGNLATEKGVDGITLNLFETCNDVMEKSHFFLNYPGREIYQHPRRSVPTRSTTFFVKASKDQIPIRMFDQFWDELESFFTVPFYIHDFDIALDLHHEKIGLRFKNLCYDRKDVHRLVKFYTIAKDIQRIEIAGIGKVIESPEEAMSYAQVLDFRCDMAEQVIDSKRILKKKDEVIEELKKENLQLRTRQEAFTSQKLVDSFRIT